MDWKEIYDESYEGSSSSLHDKLNELSVEERYTEKLFLNEGAMKNIYHCTDLFTSREVAYATPKSDAPEMTESFLREANISASLQHPNIIPVYDIGLSPDSPFFTMKMIKGKNLADTVKADGSDYSNSNYLNIFIKVCEAISFSHSKGVIHLDLKPENIQISEFGEVLVCDWGLAKVIDWSIVDESSYLNEEAFHRADVLQTTLFGYIKGTPGYLSPEQAQGSKSKKTYSSDIYALGAILYFILTKEAPVQGENLEEILIKTLSGDIKPPRTLDRSIPAALEAICLKALNVDISERYQSVEEIISDIEFYNEGFAPKAQRVNLAQNALLVIRRRPLLFGVTLFSISLLALVSSSANYQLQAKNTVLEEQKLEIGKQKSEIEEHLKSVEESKKRLQEIALLASKEAGEKAYDLYRDLRFDKAKEFAKTALSLDPKNRGANDLLLELAIINLDSETAKKYFKIAKKNNTYLYKLLSRVKEPFISETVRPQKILEILRVLPSTWLLSRNLTLKYNQIVPHSEEKMDYFVPILKIHNSQEEINFSWIYKDGKYEVDLSRNNKKITRLYALNGLAISKLDLSFSSEVDLGGFLCRSIEYLDLSNAVIARRDMKYFHKLRFPRLKTLILDNYSSEEPNLNGLRYTAIRELSLKKCEIKNFDFLFYMKDLEKIYLDLVPDNFPKQFLAKVIITEKD